MTFKVSQLLGLFIVLLSFNFISSQQILLAEDGATSDRLGYSVSIYGNFSVLGAPFDDIGANIDQGSAYIFHFNGSHWVQFQKLVAPDGGNHNFFGTSVSIYGNFLAVGSPQHTVGSHLYQGAVYIYRYNGTRWNLFQKLLASDGFTNDQFGTSVSLYGNYLVVGSPLDNVDNKNNQGSAYVFHYNGSQWIETQHLIANDGAFNDQFGYSVSIYERYIVIGAPYDDIGEIIDQGSAYIFYLNGSTWTQIQKLTASEGAINDRFGWSVSIHGNYLVIGSPYDNVLNVTDRGSAYVFRLDGIYWEFFQLLIAPDGSTNDLFGYSVAIYGNHILVGAPYNQVGSTIGQGSAYLFRFNITNYLYRFEEQLVAPDGGTNDRFGWAVDIDDRYALVGAPFDNTGDHANQGSGYIFDLIY